MTNTFIYQSFAQAKQEIHDIEPIDYFFAKEMTPNYPCSDTTLISHLLLALSQSARLGHTCLPLREVAQHRFGYKSDDTGVITHHGYDFPALAPLVHFVQEVFFAPDHNKGVCYVNECLYMRRNFLFEQELQQELNTRIQITSPVDRVLLKDTVETLFPDANIEQQNLARTPSQANTQHKEIDWQKVAVANSLNKKISVIAGGPGTGKTYTVTKLIAALVSLHQQQYNDKVLDVSLVAPTGKAAQRLSESIINAVNGFKGTIDDKVLAAIPTDAHTIHRFLGVIPNQLQFKQHQDNQVQCDVLILDEVSMVDLALMVRLFRALPQHTQVIMLGDADQLPSVALGSVLADIAPKPHPGYSNENASYLTQICHETDISKQLKQRQKLVKDKHAKSKALADHLSFLYKSRRFDGEGGIGLIANAVIQGDSNTSWQLLAESNNSEISFAPESEEQLNALVNQYYLPLTQAQELTKAFDILSSFRILCASRKGQHGVEAINEQVAQILGKTTHHKSKLYHGLPVMVNENNYTLNLYNGDIGLVWQNQQGQLLVAFEGEGNEYRMIMPTRLPRYEPVYAMTIHKTQGSEFGHVYMLLSNQQDSKLLSRELMYTGITRAKKHLTVTAKEPVWFSGVESKVQRHSNLSISIKE